MSLFKSHDDAFPARIDDGIDEENDEDEDDEDGLEEIDGDRSDDDDIDDGRGRTGVAREAEDEDEDTDAFFAMPPRQSFDIAYADAAGQRLSATNLIGTGGDALIRPTLRGRPRAASEPFGNLRLTQQTSRSSLSRSFASNTSNSPYLHGSSSPFASRTGLIELPPRPPSPPSLRAGSPGSGSYRGFPLRPSYFTHRSSRSSPVIAPRVSSTPSLLPTSASAGSFGGGRPRASTLQKLMSSSAGRSDASLAPPNGFEPASVRSGQHSPYGSLGTRASASQVSVGGRSISAPLANSFGT